MKRVKTAKQLTITYFSIVAFAIIGFHFTMLDSMLEGMEQIYAEQRMLKDKQTAIGLLEGSNKTQVFIPPFTTAYVGKENLPTNIVLDADSVDDKPFELDSASDVDKEMFSMRSQVLLNGQPKELYLIHFDEVYEHSEEQMFKTQTTQLLMSLLLLAISLFVVMRISNRLTRPLSELSQDVARRSPTNIATIHVPQGAVTREIHLLVERLNNYQDQIRERIERERAFNRYASHELRTPLMVIKGAVTLLGQAPSADFSERQRRRISQACNEMEDYISTLLSLTREEDIAALPLRTVDKAELEAICASHSAGMLRDDVALEIQVKETLQTKVSEGIWHILVGNLLKNALACTDTGKIEVIMQADSLAIVDSGCGLQGKPGGESYGLGLMIVRDICHKYGYEFSLRDNPQQGCTARIKLPQLNG